MRMLSLAAKDLLQIGRDKKSALFLLLMPLLFTWIFGLVFSTDARRDPRLPVGLLDFDAQGVLSASFTALLEQSDTVRPVILPESQLGGTPIAELQKRVRTEALAAAVVIPAGFSEQTMRGEPPLLTVIVDQNSPVGQAADQSIQWATTRLLGTVEIAQLSAAAREKNQRFADEAERQAYITSAMERTVAAWDNPRLTVVFDQAGDAAAAATTGLPGSYAQSSAGMLVLFAIFGLVLSGYVLLAERRAGVLQRMLTTSMTRVEIIAGHTLAMFVVAWIQILLLTAGGQLFFGVNYWRAPVAVLTMSAALALWVASLGLFISAISRQENHVILCALGSMLILGLMGGAIFPLDITGKTFAAIGHLLPSAWAIDGFQSIILRGAGIESTLLPAGILTFYAAVFFGLAVWRFRFE
jgi:ABC-2 type transport system permease protein